MAALSLTLIVIGVLIFIRNEIVFKARIKYVWSINLNDDKFDEKMGRLRQVSYEAQLFDLTKWTYNQLFPTKEEI